MNYFYFLFVLITNMGSLINSLFGVKISNPFPLFLHHFLVVVHHLILLHHVLLLGHLIFLYTIYHCRINKVLNWQDHIWAPFYFLQHPINHCFYQKYIPRHTPYNSEVVSYELFFFSFFSL